MKQNNGLKRIVTTSEALYDIIKIKNIQYYKINSKLWEYIKLKKLQTDISEKIKGKGSFIKINKDLYTLCQNVNYTNKKGKIVSYQNIKIGDKIHIMKLPSIIIGNIKDWTLNLSKLKNQKEFY